MATMIEVKNQTLEGMRDINANLAKLNRDAEYAPKLLGFSGREGIQTPDGNLIATEDATRQMAERAGMPFRVWDWLWANEEAKALDIVNDAYARWAEKTSTSTLLVRAREMEGNTFARAVLTNRYGICDNHQVLDSILSVLPEKLGQTQFKGMKQRFYLNPITGYMSFKLIIPAMMPGTESDRHDLGLAGGNDETGHRSVFVWNAFQRLGCTNQFVIPGQERMDGRILHNKSGKDSQDEYFESIRERLVGTLAKGAEVFGKYWDTRDRRLENPQETLVRLGRESGLTSKDVAAAQEGDRLARHIIEMGPTGFAVVNTLTEWARDLEDGERRMLVEAAAGRMTQLPNRRWV